jgi:hypothetical protein
MVYITARIDRRSHTGLILLHTGRVVGNISRISKTDWLIDTRGLIPAIDGIIGTSPDDAWNKARGRVSAGGVVAHV